MSISHADIETALKLLKETTPFIRVLLKDVTPSKLLVKPDENTWSINEILAHLRACADIWGISINKMLAEEHPKIRYVSPRSWQKKTNYSNQAFDESFQAFQNQRTTLLQTLQHISLEDWSRAAQFTGTVKGQHQTVYSYALRIAEHEQHHFVQFRRVLQAVMTQTS